MQVVSDGGTAWLVKFADHRVAHFGRKRTAEEFALAWASANLPCEVEVLNADGSLEYLRCFSEDG